MFFNKDKENWKFKYEEVEIKFEIMERELKRELEISRFREEQLKEVIKCSEERRLSIAHLHNESKERNISLNIAFNKYKDLYLSKCEECLNLREEIIRLRTEMVSKKEDS